MTRPLPDGPAARPVGWRPWCASAFADARAAGAPVLLSLGPSWCRATAAMASDTYADPAVAGLIADRFIPIRVDADARPDIADRYGLSGWPTTAFLSPEGDLLGGETYVPPERMRGLLPQVADAFAAQRGAIAGRRAPAPDAPVAAAAPDQTIDGWVASHLLEQFDAKHGGFGAAPKRVYAAALEYAARRAASGDERFAEVVDRTLRAIGWGGLYDQANGGVFRYCARSDWTQPATEKLLSVNAAVLRLLLERDGDDYRDRAAHLARYVHRTLLGRPQGRAVFFASQRADPDYYAGETVSPPPVDRAIYADCTALMVRAWVRAAAVLGDETLLADAVDALEHVVAGTYERGGGIAHRAGEGEEGTAVVRGLLGDQVAASAALLDLFAVTDRDVYLDMAQELMHFCLHHLWDDTAGGFRDRVHADGDIGLLRVVAYPFALNCDAARVLLRLARLTGQPQFRDRAVSALAGQAAAARSHGPAAAAYALTLQDLATARDPDPAC
ncbi:MAG: thioredoxin domain-containing protein [Acidobacteria bacterium]|nr:thioredoxin domain-containing protein [Acidobacteriota bacterium]MYJ04812.1 thioredoxin domain-containing protein [Acidobacteriota bacterium]